MANTLRQLISQEHLHEIFEYRDGALFWKYDTHQPKQWNTRHAGKVAGYREPNGYVSVHFMPNERNKLTKPRPIGVHRLIFCFHHGYYPPQVDHINGNRADNRIENLRAAVSVQNAANRAPQRTNTTGVPGVRRHSDGHFEARVQFNNKRYQVGSFRTLQEARAAIIAASASIRGEWHREGA